MIELKAILDFIAAIPPFDHLSEEQLLPLPKAMTVIYIRRGEELAAKSPSKLYIIRKGALSIYSSGGNLLGKLAEGDVCTSFCAADMMPEFYIQASEDCLLYCIGCQELQTLLPDARIRDYIHHSAAQRLKQAVAQLQQQNHHLLYTTVSEVCRQPIIKVEEQTSIQQSAYLMNEYDISSLLITKHNQPIGLVTDKDFRQRCIAQNLPTSEPIASIMSRDIICIEAHHSLFEALLLMSRHRVHHLPVMQNGQVIGMLSSTDLMRQEGLNPIHISQTINKAKSLDELVVAAGLLPRLQTQLSSMGIDPLHLGHSISTISDAITQKLIELAIAELGPAPVPYAWVVAGSQARQEQSAHSDQDNALIIDNAVQPEQMDWFEQLARFVNDGLNECGFIYCPGEVMASNPQWRQTEAVWQDYFKTWITEPEPKALMLSSIFFDLRCVYGDQSLLKRIRQNMLRLTPHHQFFLAHLTRNALSHRPPLGFFRDFVLVHDGQHDDTLDLKHSGLVPIIDLARIYALAEGIEAIGTLERLQAAAGTPSLSRGGAANLSDAFTFISELRLKHQARQFQSGQPMDNYLAPHDLSKLEREHLKDAFKIIQTMQASLEMRYHAGQI